MTERKALINIVPLLMRIEAGECDSYPGESCSRSCENVANDALEIALDALAPYPGYDRYDNVDDSCGGIGDDGVCGVHKHGTPGCINQPKKCGCGLDPDHRGCCVDRPCNHPNWVECE